MNPANPEEAVVLEFCAACARRDIDELMAFFTPDAVYHNIPFEPAVGTDAIRAVLDMFIPGSPEVTFEMVNVASNGPVVFTERVDHLSFNGVSVALPVAGVFEVRDSKIAAWRDYFDLQMLLNPSGA
jgi:limonene-1,2-epoxide hydrolase